MFDIENEIMENNQHIEKLEKMLLVMNESEKQVLSDLFDKVDGTKRVLPMIKDTLLDIKHKTAIVKSKQPSHVDKKVFKKRRLIKMRGNII